MKTYGSFSNLAEPQDPQINFVDRLNNYYEYISCGLDNLFPQSLAELSRKSTVHRALLKSKALYITGKGFECEDVKTMEFLNRVNLNESLRNVSQKVIYDYITFGNAWLQIISKGNVTQLYHVDSTKVRLAKKEGYCIIHPDWNNFNSRKDLAKTVGIYPNFVKIDGVNVSMIQIKDYEPEFYYYGVPSYLAALKVATIGHKTDKWNLSRLDNAFSPSKMIVVEDNLKSEEEANELKNKIIDTFTGEGNQGKSFVIIKEPGGGDTVKVETFAQNEEGNWEKLHQQASVDLVVAHGWRRSLIGFSDNTGFDTDRILLDYNDVLYNIIQPTQEIFLEVYREILRQMGLSDEINFVNKPPVSPKRNILNNTQMQEIANINGMVKQGLMSEDAAINLLKVSLLIDAQAAKGLLL